MYEEKHLSPTRDEIYEDFIRNLSRIEAALQKKLPSLQKACCRTAIFIRSKKLYISPRLYYIIFLDS